MPKYLPCVIPDRVIAKKFKIEVKFPLLENSFLEEQRHFLDH